MPTAGGAWAPTIRHRDGVFHLVITDRDGARDAALHRHGSGRARGARATSSCRADGAESVNGIDPDLAWDDDGTAYITYSGLIMSGAQIGAHLGVQQVKVDLDRHIALEEPRSLWSGTGGMFPEAPHLYRYEGTGT